MPENVTNDPVCGQRSSGEHEPLLATSARRTYDAFWQVHNANETEKNYSPSSLSAQPSRIYHTEKKMIRVYHQNYTTMTHSVKETSVLPPESGLV